MKFHIIVFFHRKIAQSLGIPWKEYWDFLNSFVDITTEEGLEKLESYLAEKYEECLRKQSLEFDLSELEQKLSQFTLHSPTDDGDISVKDSRSSEGPFGFYMKTTEESVNIMNQRSAETLSIQNNNNNDIGASPVLQGKTVTPRENSGHTQVENFEKKLSENEERSSSDNSDSVDTEKVVESKEKWYDTEADMDVSEHVNLDNLDADKTVTEPEKLEKSNLNTYRNPTRISESESDDMESEVGSYYTAAESLNPPGGSDMDEDGLHTPVPSPTGGCDIYLMGYVKS